MPVAQAHGGRDYEQEGARLEHKDVAIRVDGPSGKGVASMPSLDDAIAALLDLRAHVLWIWLSVSAHSLGASAAT